MLDARCPSSDLPHDVTWCLVELSRAFRMTHTSYTRMPGYQDLIICALKRMLSISSPEFYCMGEPYSVLKVVLPWILWNSWNMTKYISYFVFHWRLLDEVSAIEFKVVLPRSPWGSHPLKWFYWEWSPWRTTALPQHLGCILACFKGCFGEWNVPDHYVRRVHKACYQWVTNGDTETPYSPI